MSKRIDILVDIESLGRTADSLIYEIGAIAFDRETDKEISTYHCSLSIKNMKDITITASTLLWWLKENPELMRHVLSGENESEVDEVFYDEKSLLSSFVEWIKYDIDRKLGKFGEYINVFLWGNGILFDNRLLKEHMEKYNIEYPIFYRNDRDLRTLIELAAEMTGCKDDKEFREKYVLKNTTEHDALDDVRNEYNAMKVAYEIITNQNKEK